MVVGGVLKPSAQQQGVQEVQEVQEVQNAKRSRQLLGVLHSTIHEFMRACMLLYGHLHQLHPGSPAGVTHTAVQLMQQLYSSTKFSTQSPNSPLNSFLVQLCSKFVQVTRVQIMSSPYITYSESSGQL